MSVDIVDNLFSDLELSEIKNAICSVDIPDVPHNHKGGVGHDKVLAREQVGDIPIGKEIKDKLTQFVNDRYGPGLVLHHAMYANYSNKHGNPNLPPHFDRDQCSVVIDYQLESNTYWDLGVGLNTYSIKDNSALIFNANTNIHWRPHKDFEDGEYVKMILFRFFNPIDRVDYSHLPQFDNHSIFKEVNSYRDSLYSNRKSEAEK